MTTEPPVHTPWSVSATPQRPQRVTTGPPVHTPWSVSATPQPSQRVTTEPPVHTPLSVSATPQPPQQVPLPIPVNPTTGTFVLNLLQCCPPLVRTCFGCSQSLKPGGIIASPPYDLTIITRMNRGYRSNSGGELMFKETNVYFHVHLSCIKMKQPYFSPECIIVPNWLFYYLKPEHVQFLREFGVQV